MRDDHMKEMRKGITSATEMVKREMATVREDHIKEMATMRKDMATLRETEKHITGETATTKKDIMKEMAALKKDYTKEMNNLREKEMAAEKHIRAMVAVKEDHKKELASLREELKKMNQQMAERQQSMDRKLAKHREIEAEHVSKMKEMRAKEDSHTEEIRKLKHMIALNEADVQKKLEEQEKKINEAKCSHAQVDRAPVPRSTPSSPDAIKCTKCGYNNGEPSLLGMCVKCYRSNRPRKASKSQATPEFSGDHDVRPCRSPGCEFFGHAENDFYCSKCNERRTVSTLSPGSDQDTRNKKDLSWADALKRTN